MVTVRLVVPYFFFFLNPDLFGQAILIYALLKHTFLIIAVGELLEVVEWPTNIQTISEFRLRLGFEPTSYMVTEVDGKLDALVNSGAVLYVECYEQTEKDFTLADYVRLLNTTIVPAVWRWSIIPIHFGIGNRSGPMK